MLKGFKEAKTALASFRLASKRFGKLGAPRLFQVLMIWPMRRMGRRTSHTSITKNLVGGTPISSFVTSIVFHLAHVTPDMASSMLGIVESCRGLETFFLFAECLSQVELHQILCAVRDHSSTSLVKLECVLPHGLSHLPLFYSASFPNLKVFTSGFSKPNQPVRPHIKVPFPADHPIVTQMYSFRHLHSLRIGDPAILYQQINWDSPNLSALTLEANHEFPVEDLLLPFLDNNGSHLSAMETRYIGPRRLDVYKFCPNLVDFILDIDSNPCLMPLKGAVLHKSLTRIGLRGCSLSFWDLEDTSADIFRFLEEFVREGSYPSLREVHFLDLDSKVFEHFPWERPIAWTWLFYLAKYEDVGIQMYDKNGKSLHDAKLDSLQDFASELKYTAERMDSLFRGRLPPLTKKCSE